MLDTNYSSYNQRRFKYVYKIVQFLKLVQLLTFHTKPVTFICIYMREHFIIFYLKKRKMC